MENRTSKLLIESFAPEPIAAHAGLFLQKRDFTHSVQHGLSPAEHVEPAFSFGFTLPLRAKLPRDVEQASPFL